MKTALALAVCGTLNITSTLSSAPWLPRQASNADAAGSWYAGKLDGGGTVSPGCNATTWSERKVLLSAIPGQPGRFRGEWATSFSRIWVSNNGLKCRWSGEADFTAMQFAVTGFELTGTSSAPGVIAVHGRYHDCSGNACSAYYPKPIQDFDTELRVSGATLTDTNRTADAQDDISFQPIAWQSQTDADVRKEARPILQMVDSEDVEAFYASGATEALKLHTPRQQFVEALKLLHSKARVVSRDVFRLVPATSAPQVSKEPGEFALLINNAYLNNNANALEFVLLVRVNGHWRVNDLVWS